MMMMIAAIAALSAGMLTAPAAGARLNVPTFLRGGDVRASDARSVAAEVAHARGVRDFGHLDGRSAVGVGVMLRVRHQDELERLILMQGNPKSPLYHHYLTSAQFNNYFAPDPVTYAHVLSTLQRHGFRIAETYANRGFVRAQAPSASVERYFSTNMHSLWQPGYGVRYGNVTPARMPDDLRGIAVSVAGLHSIVTMHHTLHVADPSVVRSSPYYAYALQQSRAEQARSAAAARSAAVARTRAAASFSARAIIASRKHGGALASRQPYNVATPIASATPSAPMGPDPVLTPGNPANDFTASVGGYDPTIYAAAYDYPVDHGYGGSNHPMANVIDEDFLAGDAAKQYAAFKIPRSGKTYRFCGLSSGGPTCFGLIGKADAIGESTLDATIMTSLAPASDYYEYIAAGFFDLPIESSYELAVNHNVAEVVNSSFGGCETDDPSFGYATNYIAMQGAALGITFSASTGDTGATNCGTYAMNGAPQTAVNTSLPSSNYYFTAIGGTDFYPVNSCTTGAAGANCYTRETAWTNGGGGSSVYLSIPPWQKNAAMATAMTNPSAVSTTMRNTPDVSFTADFLPPGVGMAFFHNGSEGTSGGTSVGSPMFAAMQVEINQVQKSRNGFVSPGLYAIFDKFASFGFRDVVGGTNGRYQAVPGFDDASGIGSPLGWELAGAENGSAGLPERPTNPTPPPQPPTPVPSITPTITPTMVPLPHPSGTAFAVTTIAGKSCSSGVPEPKASAGPITANSATDCLNSPTGIVYTATGQGTNPFLFISDFGSGYLRGIDLTAKTVTTFNDITWNNAARAAAATQASDLYGITIGGTTNNAGLYVTSAGDSTVNQIVLPTTPDPVATPHSRTRSEAGTSTVVFDVTGNNIFDTSANNGNLYAIEFAPSGGPVSTLSFTAASTLPTGNFGLTVDNLNPQNLVITNAQMNAIFKATEQPQNSTVSPFVSGAPLNMPEGITQIGGTFYVANCGGNNIIKVTSAGVMSIVAGDGAASETDGVNTGAEFNCPFGITNDGVNLYVTDLVGNTIRKITQVQ